ncbi:MAG: T9SS type A sorting domain-containing protein, partial [bacterium]
NFVIAWEDSRNNNDNGNSDIYFQRYNSMGVAQGNNQKANDDTGIKDQNYVSIDMNDSGSFVVAWRDNRNSNPDIYFQYYDSSGVKQGENQRANDVNREAQSHPSISMDGSGGFVIAWQDNRYGNPDIYFQRYNSSGMPLGNNQKANDDAGDIDHWGASIAMDKSGNFVIAWEDERNVNRDIYFQRYESNGVKKGNNQRTNDAGSAAASNALVIAIDDDGNFVIAWQDERNVNSSVYYQRYDSSGDAQEKNQRANDVVVIAQQGSPAIAMNGSGNFVIGWPDNRNNLFSDVYFQYYNSSGIAQGNNQFAAQFYLFRFGRTISIAIDDLNNFLILWSMAEFHGDGWGYTIEYQLYNSYGIPLGDEQIADYTYYGRSVGSSIAMNGCGNFVIVYTRNDNICFQQYNAFGVKQGNAQKVNDMATGETQNAPAIAMNDNGNFVIAWEDRRHDNFDIYFQRYNSMALAQGNNQRANDDAGSTDQYRPSIAMDGSGNFVIAWEDYRHDNSDVYFQRYDSMGVAQGNNEIANDDAGSTDQYHPSIAMDGNGNSIIVWEDYRYGVDNPDIIGQRYYPDGTKRGDNCRIVADGPFKFEKYPVVVANSQQLVFCWMDNRRLKGWDIFAKITTWDWEGVTSVPEQRQLPDNFVLFQNYPNPFNPSTSIEFALPKSAFVTLKLCNLLGEEVTKLIAEQREAGTHKLNWDARGLTSGVYLYQLEAGGIVQSKKLILMR